MCYRKPGPRCSPHARARMVSALEAKDYKRYEEAKAEYELTPDGIRELRVSGNEDKANQKQAERESLISKYHTVKSLIHKSDELESVDIFRAAKLRQVANNISVAIQPRSDADFTKEMNRTVRTISDRTGLAESQIRSEIISNEAYFRTVLLPTVEKQGYHEKALIKYAQSNKVPSLVEVESLNNRGAGALWIEDGKVVDSNAYTKKVKSIDFKGIVKAGNKSVDVYGICKYTAGDGGAQDNQAADVRYSLQEVDTDSDFLVIATLDGSYWDKKIALDGRRVSRRAALREHFSYLPNVIITNYRYLEQNVVKWKKGQ